MVKWDDVREDFEPDGSLRDIYVVSANPVVWDRALEFLLQAGNARYSIDDAAAVLPANAADAVFVACSARVRSPAATRESIRRRCRRRRSGRSATASAALVAEAL